MIEVKELTFKYKRNTKNIINNISLEINSGVYGLVGANGAGKTTLLKIIATLLPFSDGKLEINGFDVKEDLSKIRPQIGYVPQKFEFFEMLSLYEFLYYIGLNKKMSDKDINESIEYWIRKFNLVDKKSEKMKSLSGGMKQRVAIIQALIGDPKILILDEPTVGLDPIERLRFKNIINEIKNEKIIIISTHIISDVSALCDKIGVMVSGNMLYSGPIEKFIEQAKGRISTMTIGQHEYIPEEIMDKVISIKRFEDKIYIKFIDDFNTESQIIPDLEDAYFFKIKESELNI
ncbi:ATP-binding cassette domain-containing protein [Streptococcus agalactiae]|uniref:ATP-binding cassette domain-containing protein n=1 Tax=Streptococcus agalactiae TaxID=1311 RepID=UPI00232EF0AB|nr:ATP-binding cassette domain-containing protein [Streptococcus agalactiae]MDB8662943.1 ATP-binding cassette domain-containing protein [Streptococcus agalactiae]MDB8668729.1 ATP-binding cassette domain-containing protein [Streptococcus agalactiae]